MRKRTNILLYFGVALALLTGCDQETTIVPPPCGEDAVEVSLSASVSTIETTITRSGIITGTELAERESVGVFGLTEQEGSFATPYLDNLQYLYTGPSGALTPNGSATVNYPPGQDKLYLYAYYPYTPDALTDAGGNAYIPVTGTQAGNEVATDYLYTGAVTGSKALAAAGNYRIALQLKHAMSILRFNIYTDTPEYTAESHPILNKISFTTREGQEGTMNVRTGVITSNNGNNQTPMTLDYTKERPGIIAYGTPIIKDYLLLPYENADNSAIRKLTLNVSMPDGEAKDIVVFDEADNDVNQKQVIVRLKAGYITTINIKYTQSMAAKANIDTWQGGDEHTFE